MIVHILDPLCGFLRSSRTEVQGDLWLCANQLAESQEFIRPERVVLGNVPCGVGLTSALIARSDTVFPVIGRSKVAAKTDERGIELSRHLHHFRIHPVYSVG